MFYLLICYGVFISQPFRYAQACSPFFFCFAGLWRFYLSASTIRPGVSWFWGLGDFLISYSNKDTSWNAWNRHAHTVKKVLQVIVYSKCCKILRNKTFCRTELKYFFSFFLTPETHWLSVSIDSILRLDNILILFSLSYHYFSNEIVIFSCRVSYHSKCIIKI